jgi:hypothetical protein
LRKSLSRAISFVNSFEYRLGLNGSGIVAADFLPINSLAVCAGKKRVDRFQAEILTGFGSGNQRIMHLRRYPSGQHASSNKLRPASSGRDLRPAFLRFPLLFFLPSTMPLLFYRVEKD